MKILYVAGPYRAKTYLGVDRNIWMAKALAARCWEKGWAVICPHANTAHFEHITTIPPEAYIEGDLEIVRRCDAMLMMPNWQESEGAKAEHELALELGLTIYYGPHYVPEVWDA